MNVIPADAFNNFFILSHGYVCAIFHLNKCNIKMCKIYIEKNYMRFVEIDTF